MEGITKKQREYLIKWTVIAGIICGTVSAFVLLISGAGNWRETVFWMRIIIIAMGANIGTTITSWILSLSGIQGDSFFIKILKPSSFSPILALIGVIFLLFSQNEKRKDVGTILIGFAVLMTGMESMSGAVKPLAKVPEFTNILLMFKNPVLGMAAGALLTAIIQSSSASVGILQALCVTGAVSYGAALPIIMGQNIGTCVTALISSVGAKRNAKRTAFVHLYFNLIGTIVFMLVFYFLNGFFHFAFLSDAANAAGIAVVHTTFNIAATALWFPFSKVLVWLAEKTIPAEKQTEVENQAFSALTALDDRFLDNPALAIEQCRNVCGKMAEITVSALKNAISLLNHYDPAKLEAVVDAEDIIDQYEDRLGTYLIQITKNELQNKDSHTLSVLLHSIGDMERISDHAVLIADAAKEIAEKKLSFSESAKKELAVFSSAVKEVVQITMDAMKDENIGIALDVEPLEEVIDDISDEIKKRHVNRLRKGKCTIELGFILSDLLTSYKRIADHCSNISVCLIQAENDEFGRHAYLNSLKGEENRQFQKKFRNYAEKYALPDRKTIKNENPSARE